MSIFTGHGMRPSVRYLMIFWKHKIPKLFPVAASFLVVSFSRKVGSATFKKGQKSETGIAEAEETEVLLQSEHSQSRPLLKAFWSMFGTYFLLSTVCLVICDVFLFSIPKLLRYVHIYHVFLSHVQDCCVHELTDAYVMAAPTEVDTQTLIFWNLLLLMERAGLSLVLSLESTQWEEKTKPLSKAVHAFSTAVFQQWKGQAALSVLTTLLEQERVIWWRYISRYLHRLSAACCSLKAPCSLTNYKEHSCASYTS